MRPAPSPRAPPLKESQLSHDDGVGSGKEEAEVNTWGSAARKPPEANGEGHGDSDSESSFVSDDDNMSFYSANGSEYAYSARDQFSRCASPESGLTLDEPSTSPRTGRAKRALEPSFQDTDPLESTCVVSCDGGNLEKLLVTKPKREALVNMQVNGAMGIGGLLGNEIVGRGSASAAGESTSSPSGSESAPDSESGRTGGRGQGRWMKLLVRAAALGASAVIAHETRCLLRLRQLALKARAQLHAAALGARLQAQERDSGTSTRATATATSAIVDEMAAKVVSVSPKV
jgi:hypothetical protein